MSLWYEEVKQVIDSSKTATSRNKDNSTKIRARKKFVPMSLSDQKEINSIIANEQKKALQDNGAKIVTLDAIKQESSKYVGRVVDNFTSRYTGGLGGSVGGTGNRSWNLGVVGEDPNLDNFVSANIYISPAEAQAIYSQKGIPEVIIKKKSQSIRLNGVRIVNPFFTPEMQQDVENSLIKLDVAASIANSVENSLVYGGGLLYPHFHNDTPVTYALPIKTLIKQGIVGKNCIDFFVDLDRYNTVHFPSFNPTSKDYMTPERYYIPFQGADVHSSRCARIVTAPQAGYWGMIATMGWGLSDIVGWISSVYNYYSVLQAIPTMIQQMSIIVRTFQTDGILAGEGEAMLDMASEMDTIRSRRASVHNPISLDIVGDIKAIQRDFKDVAELTRLVRQDLSAKAGVPEELLFSSEKKAFASGDNSDSAWEKQLENTRYIHLNVGSQLRQLAKVLTINALGVSDEVLKVLPYTNIAFDNPRITNAVQRSEISAKVTKSIFDMCASDIPLNVAMQIAQQLSDNEFTITNEVIEELKERQKEKDKRVDEKHKLETEGMKLGNEQIKKNMVSGGEDDTGNNAPPIGKGFSKGKDEGGVEKKGHSYKDRLEQKQHETLSDEGRKFQGITKRENKKL